MSVLLATRDLPEPIYLLVPFFATLGGFLSAMKAFLDDLRPDWGHAWITGNIVGAGIGIVLVVCSMPRRRLAAMTRNEFWVSVVICVLSGAAAALVIKLFALTGDSVVLAGGVAVAMGVLLVGRIDNRARARRTERMPR